MKNNTKGIILVLTAAIAFSLGGLLIKLIPWEALSIGSGRCIFSSLIVALYLLITKHKFVLNKTTIFGAICVCGSMSLYVLANKLTTAANAIVLEYVAPVFIILINLIFYKKKPKKLDVVTMLFVMIGIILVFAEGLTAKNTLGDIIALLSGLCYALVLMMNQFENGDSLSSMLMGHIISLFVGLPSLFKETNFSSSVLLYVAILGIFQAGVGYTCISLGTKYTDALTSSLIATIEPILNPILVAVFYHEHMSLLSIVGAGIVIISVTINSILSNKVKES